MKTHVEIIVKNIQSILDQIWINPCFDTTIVENIAGESFLSENSCNVFYHFALFMKRSRMEASSSLSKDEINFIHLCTHTLINLGLGVDESVKRIALLIGKDTSQVMGIWETSNCSDGMKKIIQDLSDSISSDIAMHFPVQNSSFSTEISKVQKEKITQYNIKVGEQRIVAIPKRIGIPYRILNGVVELA